MQQCVHGDTRRAEPFPAHALGSRKHRGYTGTDCPSASGQRPRRPPFRPRPNHGFGSSDIGDTRGSAFAATDGDARTTWSAPQRTTEPGGPKPTLTLNLPEPTLVTGLDITRGLGTLPSLPTSVAVNLGNGPQVRELPGPSDDTPQTSRVTLSPFVTDKIVLSITDWEPVLDQTALGFAQAQPPASPRSASSVPTEPRSPVPEYRAQTHSTTAPSPSPVATGPTISVAGQQFPTSITATAMQLRTGAPVEARVCDLDASATLPAGQPEVVVEPGPAFSVDNLDLTTVGPSAAQRNTPLESTAWTANHRELSVTNSSIDQLIVNPESTSIGWIATAPDGSELTPVVVNGWQQGWIVPAGTAGTVTIDFPSDRWYRLGIFGGLVLLIPLLFAALVPTRREPKSLTPPRPWRSVAAGWVGVLAAAPSSAAEWERRSQLCARSSDLPRCESSARLGPHAFSSAPPAWPR